jgi:hypothetical protein
VDQTAGGCSGIDAEVEDSKRDALSSTLGSIERAR